MSADFDVCVIGSGAGGGPVAAVAAEAGYRVVVLEKGPWYEADQFLKDEIIQCRRPTFWPHKRDEPHVREWMDKAGKRHAYLTGDFWNGNLVGGASVLMSGFFLRLKPTDFRLRSTYGPIADADVVDWPMAYDDLEPWYARIEEEVGVSGLAWEDLPDDVRDKRSTEDMPFLPTREHPFADRIDQVGAKLGLHPFPTPRAVLPEDWNGRRACAYAGYCGSYGCRTEAKGSSLAAFLPRALKTKRCEIRPRAMVTKLVSDETGKVVKAEYRDAQGKRQTIEASIFVVACQAIESARLLLNSRGPKHPNGLANGSGLVGRNLLFSTFGAGWGGFRHSDRSEDAWLRSKETFVNRSLQDWYHIDDPKLGKRKGGTIDFLLMHPNPIAAGMSQAFEDRVPPGSVFWGQPLKDRLFDWMHETVNLKFEIFGEWLADRRSRVTIDPYTQDRWGTPVARVRPYSHPRNRVTAAFLMDRGLDFMRALGAENPRTVPRFGGPSTNLIAGTCRFGKDPKSSVLDVDCRAHEARNLFVTDGSFMPTAGSVPFTFTIYANARRVAERIVAQLGGPKR
ncbi:MAG: GMC family oxidoreductase [Planctomycetota bacterium]|nr:GMC family oxidoreductase [Planctomycetota bacterium]